MVWLGPQRPRRLAAKRELFATGLGEGEQGVAGFWVAELIFDDEDRDRMTRTLHPVSEMPQTHKPCCAGLTRCAQPIRVLASGGVPLLPRTVVGIVGVHGQPRAAHASPPPT
jgi:hypothetical protein